MLIRLVYLSSITAGVTSDDIDRIVAHSATANEARGITGMLALDGERVCQILEGAEDAVDALYETIRHDPRHSSIVLLDRQPVDTRHFGAWGMRRRHMADIVAFAFNL